jgi:hypothetical protein
MHAAFSLRVMTHSAGILAMRVAHCHAGRGRCASQINFMIALTGSAGGEVRISVFSPDLRRLSALAGIWTGLAMAMVVVPAHAVLGGAPMTPPSGATVGAAVTHAVASAATSAAATASVPAATPYTVRTTTLATGTAVNEYIGTDGTVFGIAWQGPRLPDLPTLLGSYFPQYVQGIQTQRASGVARGPVSVVDSGLIVRSGGHMGAFAGHAYLPQALPAGVTGSDIH